MEFFTPTKAFGFGVAVPLLVVGAFHIFAEPATVVQPIQVPESFRKNGFTEQTLQRMLVDTLSELRTTAEGVIPENADGEQVLSGLDFPDFSVPETGLSVRSLIAYARMVLKLDSSLFGSVTGSSAGFSVELTLRDSQGETVVIHRTTANKTLSGRKTPETPAQGLTETQALEQTLRDAAMEILRHQSALLYADNLLQNQQSECFSEKAKCDFHEVREKYGQIAAGGGEKSHQSKRKTSWTKRMLSTLHLSTDDPKTPSTKNNAPWAELMLSKLDELDGNYEGAIKHASKIDEQSKQDKSWEKALSWAYYNWGVALNDLGCYQAGADVLSASVTKNPSYPPAHNALARSYNALATASVRAEPKTASLTDFRAQARAEATKAVELDPGYQEAFVNLGDALRPQRAASAGQNMKAADDGNEKEAREAYEKAIELNVDTAGRARQQLASMPGGYPAAASERVAKKRPECRQDLPPSLLEASGCSDAEIRVAATRGNEPVRMRLTGSRKAASVCTNPALLLRQSDFIANPADKSGQITAIQRDVEGTGRLHTRRQRG